MRKDMKKVIVDTYKVDGWCDRPPIRAAKRIRLIFDEDGMPDVYDRFSGNIKPMRACKWADDYKYSGDRLQPLYRFLESRCGRKWDDVYSEICRDLNPKSVLDNHVRQHVNSFVEEETMLVDGEVMRSRSFDGVYTPIWSGFYVHPITRVLCYKPYRRHFYRKDAVPKYDVRKADGENLCYIWRPKDGVWFYAWCQSPTLRTEQNIFQPMDIFEPPRKAVIRSTHEFKYRELYGPFGWVTRLIRTASKKEIRDYRLNV